MAKAGGTGQRSKLFFFSKLGMHRSHRRRLMPNRFRIGGCRKTPLCRLLAPIICSSKDTFV